MEQRYQDPTGFEVRFPGGWTPFRHASGAAMVSHLREPAFVVVDELPNPIPDGGAAGILERLDFPTAVLLVQAKPSPVDSRNPKRASRQVQFQFPGGIAAEASLTCEVTGAGAVVTICAAQDLARMSPELWQIRGSYSSPMTRASMAGGAAPPPPPLGNAAAAPPPPPPPQPKPQAGVLTFRRITEPQSGTFSIETPEGWQTRGGFLHPGLGDCRFFAETQSPEGVLVFLGDPNCPQNFYQNPMSWGQDFIPYPTGCVFLNLKCSGKELAKWYLKNVAGKRLGMLETGTETERKDIADLNKRWHPELAPMRATVYQVALRAGNRNGRLLAFTFTSGGIWGVGEQWTGNVLVSLAPQGLESVAEQVSMRMLQSLQFTQRYVQIVQQDEATIAGNGNIAVANQQQWFAGQQAAHRAQVQAGDAQVAGYWDQQRTNERMWASWDHNQQVNADASQNWADAMRGNQRLYDESIGREYTVSSGSNYYWVDNAGRVTGTDTSNPPDYQNDYRLLKKL